MLRYILWRIAVMVPTLLIISALIFTIIVLTICLAGSLWVMYHMNTNMMPGMSSGDMGAM